MRLYLQRLVLTRNLMDIEVLLDNCPVEIVLDFHMVASLVEALYLVVAWNYVNVKKLHYK